LAYRLVDTEGKAGPSDPLATLEKTTEAETRLKTVQAPRLEALQAVSDAQGIDPYTASVRLRKRFRVEKKAEQALVAADDALKDRYALPAELTLVRDDKDTAERDKREWEEARAVERETAANKRRRIAERPLAPVLLRSAVSGSKGGSAGLSALGQRILQNTARRTADSKPLNR
jgi:coiled-coil domain-containing protein 130